MIFNSGPSMANIQILLPFFFLLPQIARVYSQDCLTSRCRDGPIVRFPFRLRGKQPSRCGYPAAGFTLSCNSQSQLTTLALPGGNFIVRVFDYKNQTIWINDVPNSCFAEKLLLHPSTLHSTPFTIHGDENYTFLNCSSSQRTSLPFTAKIINCLGGGEYTVHAVPSSSYNAAYAPAAAPSSSSSSPELCSVIWSGSVPRAVASEWEVKFLGDVGSGFALTWSQPNCSECEARGRNCGLDMEKNQIVCTAREKNHVLPRAAKYGIIIGVGIPGLLLIIAIANYIYGRITNFGHHRQLSRSDDVSTSTAHPSTHVAVGLDAPTIESYPKILLGESGRLPRANDNTCSICLGEYQAKESLRTIPECNHYFHANCIDEWLKLNATCPVCRKSPEESSHDVTPSSSVYSSSTSLASL